jgi:hypothetical protein
MTSFTKISYRLNLQSYFFEKKKKKELLCEIKAELFAKLCVTCGKKNFVLDRKQKQNFRGWLEMITQIELVVG